MLRSFTFLLVLSMILPSCMTKKVVLYGSKQDEIFYCADYLCAKEDHGHIDSIYTDIPSDMYFDGADIITFPIHYKIIDSPATLQSIEEADIIKATVILNKAFAPSGIQFNIKKVSLMSNGPNLQEIAENDYALYSDFALKNDDPEAITIYLIDDNDKYCDNINNTISCRRIHGFTFILERNYPNIVISKKDLLNEKVLSHEMGHFFGLYHTHRTTEGIESIARIDCEVTGDHLCSTPADPGPAYSVYIDFTRCEMIGLKNDNGYEYKPLIQNYMSYYNPCYRVEFSFTDEQHLVMRTAALGPQRNMLMIAKKLN